MSKCRSGRASHAYWLVGAGRGGRALGRAAAAVRRVRKGKQGRMATAELQVLEQEGKMRFGPPPENSRAIKCLGPGQGVGCAAHSKPQR